MFESCKHIPRFKKLTARFCPFGFRSYLSKDIISEEHKPRVCIFNFCEAGNMVLFILSLLESYISAGTRALARKGYLEPAAHFQELYTLYLYENQEVIFIMKRF